MSEHYEDIRDAVAKLCAQFPGEYWRDLDRERAYPGEFVTALTDGGYLSVLIPEEYGGSGLGITAAAAIIEEIHKSGCNGAACHAQMYTMGTVLRHGNNEQKQAYLPKIATGELRLQAFGVTEPTSGTDTLGLRTTAVKEDNDSFLNFEEKQVKITDTGFDSVAFYLSTNPGEDLKPLTDIASGGEISRIMLSIKTVLQTNDPAETLIFDEIDSGISGETAEKVSQALSKLSEVKQVICITLCILLFR